MALTDEQKQFYVDIIDVVWQGSMQNNEVENISDSVGNKIEKVLYEIQNCSNAVKTLFPIHAIIYETVIYPDKWVEKYPLLVPVTVPEWIGFLLTKRQFIPCVHGAAVNWKSAVKMDLNGM